MLWQEKCADGIRTFFFALLHAKRGVFVHALRVRVWGGVPTPRILSCFFKSREKPRSVLPRQGHAFHAMESSRKGDGFILFASAKRTKKQPGLRPATSVQNSIDYVFSCCFRLSSLHRHVVRPTFSDVLNRCEREIVVQTQDHAFRKWEVVQQAHRGMSHSKRVAARYLCCGENLFLRCAD